MSLKKATAFEHGLQTPNGTARQTMGEAFQFVELPRARKVGQSYLSSIGTTLYSLAITFWKLAAKPILTRQMHQIPDLLIVNGPGTCVMVVLVYKLLRVSCELSLPLVPSIILTVKYLQVMGQRSPEIIYVESFARVTSLSLSGKILKNVVDRFIVQWPINEDNDSRAGKVGDDGAVSNVGKNKESLSNVEYHGWLI
jgi:beta-1,4-N-acetylglucosaminyltransferase